MIERAIERWWLRIVERHVCRRVREGAFISFIGKIVRRLQ